MRFLALLAMLLVAGCSAKAPSALAPGVFAGAGKNRLCIAGEAEAPRSGLIVYAADGASNCSLSGKLAGSGSAFTLTPKGEGACAVGLMLAGEKMTIVSAPAGCAYYCGPGASLAGKSFDRDSKATPAVDLAGDPLC